MSAVVRHLLLGGMICALIIGVSLRVYIWAKNPAFWIDEAMLALNIEERSYPQFFERLDWNQGAPVGYLMLVKLLRETFGPSEMVYRLPSLVFGCLTLFGFMALAHRLLPRVGAQVATAMLALSPYHVNYALEFKQYETDAAFAVLLLWAGHLRPSWSRAMGLAVLGMLSVWCSHPAIFMLGGLASAYALEFYRTRDQRIGIMRLMVVGLWGLSFLACWYFVIRQLGENDYLKNYWAGKFAPIPFLPNDWAWYLHHGVDLFHKPGGYATEDTNLAGLAFVAWLVGMWVWAREHGTFWLALLIPLLLALLASALHKYPFAPRLMVFAIPLLILGVVRGGLALGELLTPLSRFTGVLLLALLFAPGITECWWLMQRPMHPEKGRELIKIMRVKYQPGDKVYVYFGAIPAWKFYTRGEAWADAAVLGVFDRAPRPKIIHEELNGFRGQPRVWIFVSHPVGDDEVGLRGFAEAHGQPIIETKAVEDWLWLYDFSKPPRP
ncbi:MAG: hypothetical protein ACRC8S_08840 [Fimbriiglobus sp.]